MNLPSKSLKKQNELRPLEERETSPAQFDLNGEFQPTEASIWKKALALLLQIVLIGAIIFGAWKVSTWIIDSAPTAERKSRDRVARLVEVTPAQLAKTGPVVQAWGEVRPAQTLIVRPELSGMLAWVHPEVTVGGRLPANEVVARFDDRELKLAVTRAEADIAEIEARILIEQGQAEIGKRELTRLSRNLTQAQRDLVLRKPQMAQLEAEKASAIAARDQAQLALDRAEVRTPFEAIVTAETVAPGAMVSQGTEAATLVAADRFNVVLAVPATALTWIRVDGSQSVELSQPGSWPDGITRTGKIMRLGSALSETGRMAELMIEVTAPLDPPALLLGSFVQGSITGAPLPGTVEIDRAYLRDDDTVWVMSAEDKLQIRDVTVVWRGASNVLISAGLTPGDRVVTTALSSFAEGMNLRVRNEVSG
ncbi:MAG: efflux RND transporter periplasmic adaptor subunit [Pseudomonadota bacterium]